MKWLIFESCGQQRQWPRIRKRIVFLVHGAHAATQGQPSAWSTRPRTQPPPGMGSEDGLAGCGKTPVFSKGSLIAVRCCV